jgi:dynein heavy chain
MPLSSMGTIWSQPISVSQPHRAGRFNYVTPTSYIELLTSFTTLLGSKQQEVSEAKARYEAGLLKLEDTAQQVAVMQTELTALKPSLELTVAEVKQLVAAVDKEKAEVVEPKKAAVDAEVQIADAAAQEARDRPLTP